MIVFVPAYDEATRANLAVARDLQMNHTQVLFSDDATKEGLHAALRENGAPLFAMAHGKPDHLRAQADEVALVAQDAWLIDRRSVFAFACHTAARLGPDLSSGGVSWWGYIQEVTAPDPRDLFRKLFVRIFRYIGVAFAGAHSTDQRSNVLVQIKILCDQAAWEVDEAAEANPTLDVLETYQSLRDIWQYLRVWGAQAEHAESHTAAPPVVAKPYL